MDKRQMHKEMFAHLQQQLDKNCTPEDDIFYYHSSEDRIVLSHALFWVMTQSLGGKVSKEKFFLLLRLYQEEMLEAYLVESEDFRELLSYCNILYNILPVILQGIPAFRADKSARKLGAISVVTAGYGGDMPESLCNELLDDMDFFYNKVKCCKIELLLPKLNKMVEAELQVLSRYRVI